MAEVRGAGSSPVGAHLSERTASPATPVQHVEVERADRPDPPITNPPTPVGGLDESHVNYDTGEITDAEIVDEPPADDWPATPTIPGADQ